MLISFVIPSYNEELSLRKLYEQIVRMQSRLGTNLRSFLWMTAVPIIRCQVLEDLHQKTRGSK